MHHNGPTDKQLTKIAPMSLWVKATKQAFRSDHKRHRTGCVIYDLNDTSLTLTEGCAHTHDGSRRARSVHAEVDALDRWLYFDNMEGRIKPSAVVVTLTKTGNFASSSKPCVECARRLLRSDVHYVTFAERANDGSWQIVSLPPDELSDLKQTRYSSSQLQPSLS